MKVKMGLDKDSWVFEHRQVMEQSIGRSLYPGETVHHKNGVRDDNRLCNLELWTRAQMPGQRVSDRIPWYIEQLALYGYTVQGGAQAELFNYPAT